MSCSIRSPFEIYFMMSGLWKSSFLLYLFLHVSIRVSIKGPYYYVLFKIVLENTFNLNSSTFLSGYMSLRRWMYQRKIHFVFFKFLDIDSQLSIFPSPKQHYYYPFAFCIGFYFKAVVLCWTIYKYLKYVFLLNTRHDLVSVFECIKSSIILL